MTTADRKSPPHRIAELSTDLERLRGELTRRERDAESLQREKSRLQRKNSRLQRENDRLKQQIEDLKQQLDEARRAGRRQAAPFAKDRPQGRGRRPGRRAGAEYGRHGCRPRPARVDETHAAPVPGECPDCGGAVEVTRVASQYQEALPVVRPVVRRFDIEVGHCSQCQRRVQGQHVLQTSDALGAAGVQLGPGVVALVVELHTEMGVPLAKVAHLLRTTFGLQVTPGGLAHVLHRAARAAAPAYTELCEQVRNAPVVTPDETGWRVDDVLRLRAPALRARGTHAGRGLRRGAGGVSNRTTVRGTAMTAIGCSAPRLATAVVERPLLYDALIAIADTGWRFDEQTNAGPLCRGASRGASGGGVSHDMSVPHVISGGGTVDLPGCGRPRGVASNPKVGEAGAHNPWKSRGRSLPLVPAVPAARFPQPHSASSSWASIIGNDPCTTLTFAAGESTKTIEVSVLDDAHDEGEETFTLVLSNASGARLQDAEATGTIENTDLMPAALLARFGRATAEQVVEHVEARMAAPRERGFRARFAGRELRPGSERDFALGFLSQFGQPMGMAPAGAGPMSANPMGAASTGAFPMGAIPGLGRAPRGLPRPDGSPRARPEQAVWRPGIEALGGQPLLNQPPRGPVEPPVPPRRPAGPARRC